MTWLYAAGVVAYVAAAIVVGRRLMRQDFHAIVSIMTEVWTQKPNAQLQLRLHIDPDYSIEKYTRVCVGLAMATLVVIWPITLAIMVIAMRVRRRKGVHR